MIPDVTVFNTAWLIEKDLKEFYKRVAGNTYREAREAFGLLSSCEKTREEFFKEYPEELSDVYSKIPRRGGDAMPPPHSTFVSPRWLPFLPSGFKKRFTPPVKSYSEAYMDSYPFSAYLWMGSNYYS